MTERCDELVEGVYRLIEESNQVFLDSLSYLDGVSDGGANRGMREKFSC